MINFHIPLSKEEWRKMRVSIINPEHIDVGDTLTLLPSFHIGRARYHCADCPGENGQVFYFNDHEHIPPEGDFGGLTVTVTEILHGVSQWKYFRDEEPIPWINFRSLTVVTTQDGNHAMGSDHWTWPSLWFRQIIFDEFPNKINIASLF